MATRDQVDAGAMVQLPADGTLGALLVSRGTVQSVDARTLYTLLRVATRFDDWIRRRIESYEFTEGQDFEVFLTSEENPSGGRPARNYALSTSMAKELAMVENNVEGKRIRQYLIKVEAAWNEPSAVMARALILAHTQVQSLRAAREADAPKVEAYDRLQDARGCFGLQNAGKQLHVPPRGFVQWLLEQKYCYRSTPDKKGRTDILPYERYQDAGLFRLVTFPVGDPPRAQQQTLVTPRGLNYFGPRVSSHFDRN